MLHMIIAIWLITDRQTNSPYIPNATLVAMLFEVWSTLTGDSSERTSSIRYQEYSNT